ncbi:MAG TPA: hypothetical protein VJ352_06390, partial [Geodermatophilus sp.]|nr:hypothetical protein [Geodermatophilus sp.]
LLALPVGTKLRLGADAVVEVTGLRNPCAQLDGIQPGLMKATLDRDEDGDVVMKSGIMGVVLAGGEVRPGEGSLAGPLTATVLRQLTVDLFVMSIGAADARAGWSEFTLEDAAVKQVGLERARSTLVVADASKLGVRAFASVAPLDAVGRLVTDAGARDPHLTPAAQETLAALDDADVEVVLA